MHSGICEQGQVRKPSQVGKVIITAEGFLMEGSGDFLLRVSHTYNLATTVYVDLIL